MICGNLGTGGAEHIKLIAGKEGVLLPDLFDFSRDELRDRPVRQWLRLCGPVDAGPEEFLHLQHRTQGIGSCPQVAPVGTDIGKGILLLHRNGVADANTDLLVFLIKYFGRKANRAQGGVDQSQQMEESGIGTLEVDRNHRNPCPS